MTDRTRNERSVDKALHQVDNYPYKTVFIGRSISLFRVSIRDWSSSLTRILRSKGRFQNLESKVKAKNDGDTIQTPDMVGVGPGHGYSPSSVLSVALTEKWHLASCTTHLPWQRLVLLVRSKFRSLCWLCRSVIIRQWMQVGFVNVAWGMEYLKKPSGTPSVQFVMMAPRHLDLSDLGIRWWRIPCKQIQLIQYHSPLQVINIPRRFRC